MGDLEGALARVRELTARNEAFNALALCDTIRSSHPQSAVAARVHIRTLVHAGRLEDALAELQAVSARQPDPNFELEIRKDLLIAWGRQGQALHCAGDHAGAADRWRRIVREVPDSLSEVFWYEAALPYGPDFLDRLKAAEDGPKTRVFVAGCGRSGTWFTLGVMTTFRSVYVLPEERHAGHFLKIVGRPEAVHVLKRRHDSHHHLADLPEPIHLVYVLRDPRDVLVSEHLDTPNYISLERWAAEMESLQRLLASGRRNTLVVRYEDLVAAPDQTQRRIADTIGLEIRAAAETFTDSFTVDERTAAIMKGLRRPDPSSIGRWRSNPERRAYIAERLADVRGVFAPLAERFGYDLDD